VNAPVIRIADNTDLVDAQDLLCFIRDEARARGCSTVIVATHSFEAPGVYETLGFLEVGRSTGTPLGYDVIVYQMRLDGSPE
jgi:hypothetical protein